MSFRFRLASLVSLVVLIGCGDTGPSDTTPVVWAQLDAGAAATCGVTDASRGYCWGEGWTLGRGGVLDRAVTSPHEIAGNHRWKVVEVGREVACGLTVTDGTLCWGRGFNAAGLDTVPTPLVGDPGFVQLTVGDTHACGLTGAGVAYCWGDDLRGQVGIGYPASLSARRDSALTVAGNLQFLELRAGPESTCGLLLNGDLSCWGGSEVEGDGFTPRTVQTGLQFSRLAYGGNIGGRGLVCADSMGMTLFCFGYEPHAGLTQPAPVVVALPAGVIPAADAVGGIWGPFLALPYAYDLQACSVDTTGALRCWGSNDYGQVGDGTMIDRPAPTPVTGLTDVAAVTAGGEHTCALKSDGSAYCWGWNGRGQLGTGQVSSGESSPRLVRPPG